MPKSVAVVMNCHFFIAKPCDGLANILHRFANVGDYHVTRFCIT